MNEAEELRRQQVLERRFQTMGLEVGLLPGGRSLVATLPLGPEPFATPDGPRVLRAVRFYTVGHDCIKCVAPRALFHLPPIRIAGCEKLDEVEARIRSAWTRRLETLDKARAWLDRLGIAIGAPQGAPVWCFDLGLEDERALATVVEPGRVILPSRGPLSGSPLGDPTDRVFSPDPSCGSSAELEIATTVRLESLARRKRAPSLRVRVDEDLPAPRPARATPLLLVGGRLATAHSLQESLRLRGFEARCVTGVGAAIDAFRSRSFELVVTEARLDRGDGIELIPALRALPGILDLPVVLVDERPGEARKLAARAAGACGYLAGPLDGARLATALAQLAGQRRRRRFARYERALSVSWPRCETPALTAEVGRGGCRLLGAAPVPDRGRFAIHVAEIGRTLRADVRVLYRLGERTPWPTHGVGLRFCGFDGDCEAAWIEYVAGLAETARSPSETASGAPPPARRRD